MAFTPTQSWTSNIALRVRRLWALKLVGTSVFTWLFFVAYFHLLRHPIHAPAVMPLTALDHWIPFQPATLVVYLTLWLYVGIAPGLQLDFFELVTYGLWVGALCLTGLAIFYFWPTQVPPIEWVTTDLPGFALLQGIDASGNACPSMHVAVAIFTAIRLDDVLRAARVPTPWRVVNLVWFLAIAWSTVAIKQHVVLDVAAGAALGVVFALASLRWRPAAGWRMRPDIIRFHRPKAESTACSPTDTAP